MLTVSTELQPILNGVVQFISYMVLAVFAENVICLLYTSDAADEL